MQRGLRGPFAFGDAAGSPFFKRPAGFDFSAVS
jgi:hypothetical protein